jgi:hypothetical protein
MQPSGECINNRTSSPAEPQSHNFIEHYAVLHISMIIHLSGLHVSSHLSSTLSTDLKLSYHEQLILFSDWRIKAAVIGCLVVHFNKNHISWHADTGQLNAQPNPRTRNSIYFLTSRGPTLSPVALLCFTWVPSHSGNVPDLQHLITKKAIKVSTVGNGEQMQC